MAKIYGNPASFRTQKVLIAAKLAGKEVDVTPVTNIPSGKLVVNFFPAIEDGNNYLAGEDAIAAYLLGSAYTPQVASHAGYASNILTPVVLAYVLPSVSAAKVEPSVVEGARKELLAKLTKLDAGLIHKTFLVNERLSYADIAVALTLLPAFQSVLSQKERDQLVNVTRYFKTIIHQAAVKAVLGEVSFATEVAKFDDVTHKKIIEDAQPKKENKKAGGKKDDKKEEKKAAAMADEPAPPKFVDPLQSLPVGTFDMDSWKRVYSNEDTVTKAVPYFWEHFDPEHCSIWYAEYKYPEELALTFMSCNLITGMFQRLEKLKKHAFGNVLLFGTDNNSTISGVWIWRGQELVFPLSPDWQVDYESYDWKKLDPKDEATKKLVNEYWTWEGDFDGKKFNQGKTFK